MTLKPAISFFYVLIPWWKQAFVRIYSKWKENILLHLILFINKPGVHVQGIQDYLKSWGRLATANVSMCCVLQGELLSPCRCSGSVRCTHEPCLIKWISERGSWSCELCYYKYQVIAISTKNPLQVTHCLLGDLVQKCKSMLQKYYILFYFIYLILLLKIPKREGSNAPVTQIGQSLDRIEWVRA